MRDLRGKRVLITGGARGIGRALALRLADEGAVILLADLEQGTLDAAVETLRAKGADARGYVVDVTDPEKIRLLRERTMADGGPIDVLVNNAGVVFGGALLDVPLQRHVMTFRVNVEGPVAMTHMFLADLIARPEAAIVNVASASGLMAIPMMTSYTASKWAAIGFSESLRQELKVLGHKNVAVTTVCPSYVATGLFEGAKAPLLTPILTPDRVANMTVAALRSGKRQVLAPWMVKTVPALKALLPAPLFDVVSDVFGVTKSMTAWKGRT